MIRRLWAGAISGALLIACSDSDGDALDACEPIEPCGGELVGTWRVEASCSERTEEQAIDTLEEELPPECNGALESAESDSSDLSLTFGADGVLTVAGSSSLRLEYTFNDACLAALYPEPRSASADTCTQLGPDMAGAMPTALVNTASCTFESGGCACVFAFAPDLSVSGPYTAADGQLTVEDQPLAYCVAGDELRLGLPSLGGSIARRQ